MDYKATVKKVVLIVLGIIVLAFGAAWFLSNRTAPDSKESTILLDTAIDKKDVEADKNPEKFPTNIPVEAGAKITQNYNATTGDGRFQATRVFETKKTLNENLKIYQDFMKTDGWEVKSTVNQSNYKMLFATKGNAHLQVAMDENTVTDIKTVDISYTELKDSTK